MAMPRSSRRRGFNSSLCPQLPALWGSADPRRSIQWLGHSPSKYVYSNLVSRYLGKYAVKRQDQSRGMAFNLGERTRTCTHGIVHAEQKNGTNQNLVVGLVWERRGFLVEDFEKRSLLSSSTRIWQGRESSACYVACLSLEVAGSLL